MQFLQTRYEESSAQLEYLQQYSLIQEDEIQHQSLQDFQQNCEQFQFKQSLCEEQQRKNTLRFDQFLQQILKMANYKHLSKYDRFIKGWLMLLFGDVFQYAYNNSNRASIKPLQFITSYRSSFIFGLLSLFLLFTIFPLEYCTIIIFLIISLIQQYTNFQSQVITSISFKSSINNLMNKIKQVYLYRQKPSKQSLRKLTINLNQFSKKLQKNFQLEPTETPFIIDKINQFFYGIYDRVKKNRYSDLFLQSDSSLIRKYYYWKLKIQNKNLQQIQNIFQQILKQFNTQQQEKQLNYIKPKPNKDIFYLILIKKYQRILEKLVVKSLNKNVFKILKSQITFRQIFNTHTKNLSQSKIKQTIEEDNKIQNIPHFSQQIKSQSDSYYYENQTIVKFEPQDKQIIKHRLNQLLKLKQQKTQKEKETLKYSQKRPIQKIQKSIFSFGISIIPPKRDMSAYYIQ